MYCVGFDIGEVYQRYIIILVLFISFRVGGFLVGTDWERGSGGQGRDARVEVKGFLIYFVEQLILFGAVPDFY